MNCSFTERISSLIDGELSAGKRAKSSGIFLAVTSAGNCALTFSTCVHISPALKRRCNRKFRIVR